jgi:hypothetical protein
VSLAWAKTPLVASKATDKAASLNFMEISFGLQIKNLSVNSRMPFRAACDAAKEGRDGNQEASGLMGGDR